MLIPYTIPVIEFLETHSLTRKTLPDKPKKKQKVRRFVDLPFTQMTLIWNKQQYSEMSEEEQMQAAIAASVNADAAEPSHPANTEEPLASASSKLKEKSDTSNQGM
jgi:hypothetical protein